MPVDAGTVLASTGKYTGGFDKNRERVQEMWQDLQATAVPAGVAS